MVAFEDLFSAGFRLLGRLDARLVDGELEDLSLVLPNRSPLPVEVKVWEGAIRLSSPKPDSRTRTLHIANRATEKVIEAALAGDLHLITIEPERVIIDGDVLLSDNTDAATPKSHRRGKPPWGRWAIERVLILNDRPSGQREIAEAAGLTPQAVSLVLQDHPHVEKAKQGWVGMPSLLESWLSEYPGPEARATHWYGLQDPTEQALQAAQFATELTAQPLVSGDVAADRYAPWRRPTSTRLYIRQFVDLSPAGFAPTEPSNATLTIGLPTDRTLWPVARSKAKHDWLAPLADPLIVLWDLMNTSRGVDAQEAAEVLKAEIGTRTA